MKYPKDLRYTTEHEWIRVEDGVAVVGITHHAQESLGEIVYFDPPEEGDPVEAGQSCCEVESTKAVSEVYSPVDGQILEVNDALEDSPEMINEDPHWGGWLFKVKLTPGVDVEALMGALMTAEAYADHLEASEA